MGGWGGKGGNDEQTVAPQQVDNSGMDAAMAQMMAMSSMSSMQQQMPQQPQISATPEMAKTEEVDWTEKNAQLAAKAKADYNVDQDKRKGRAATVHTSPLFEDEEIATTTKDLGGA